MQSAQYNGTNPNAQSGNAGLRKRMDLLRRCGSVLQGCKKVRNETYVLVRFSWFTTAHSTRRSLIAKVSVHTWRLFIPKTRQSSSRVRISLQQEVRSHCSSPKCNQHPGECLEATRPNKLSPRVTDTDGERAVLRAVLSLKWHGKTAHVLARNGKRHKVEH